MLRRLQGIVDFRHYLVDVMTVDILVVVLVIKGTMYDTTSKDVIVRIEA